MAAPACIVPVDHDAVKLAASRFHRHLRRCSRCDIRSECLCRTGRELRERKHNAVMQKWRR